MLASRQGGTAVELWRTFPPFLLYIERRRPYHPLPMGTSTLFT